MKINILISKLRKDKNISVKYLINHCMSRSTYNRFIEGKMGLSVNKFMTLINRLNITWYEFDYIKHNYYQSGPYQFNQDIQSAISSSNLRKLYTIKHNLYLNFFRDNNLKYNEDFYLFCALSLFIEKLRKRKLNDKYINFIKTYLLNRATWTSFELLLFNDSFFAFNIKTVNIFLPRIVKDLRKYNLFQSNENECIRLLINVTLLYLHKQQLTKAFKLIQKLKKSHLKNNMLIEKISIKYLEGIIMIITHKQQGFNLIKGALDCFKFTDPKTYYLAIKNNYHQILKIYKIKNQLTNNIE